ncbi:MAG TPA: phospho-sugar mutase [Acidimicrobiia bacterium]
MTTIESKARDWAAGDPDPVTAAALMSIVESGDRALLIRAMGGFLEFGTAGIRGVVGPGSNQMNRAVVIKTTRGLADFLLDSVDAGPEAPVVVGFDARPSSRQFAEDTAGVLAAAGLQVVYFEDVTPTPLVAFAAKVLKARGAVVVTASHNPPADNGYKVYGPNAAQIISPTDTAIAAAIAQTGPANSIPRLPDPFGVSDPLVRIAPGALLDRYWDEVSAYRTRIPSTTLKIVYTPLHGVGGPTVVDLFSRTLHDDFHVVESQFDPDGTFPTVAFPNPEEPGALDLALEKATEISARLVVANDPDADRLAGAVAEGSGWRLFTGNELGVILGSHLLENPPATLSERPITANSVVSSPMLADIAAVYGAEHLVTLTGFKWIINAALAVESEGAGEFLFGYEEALGYSVGRTVRDKDGMAAAILLADIAALQSEKGLSLLDLLHDLWRRHGLWVSTQKSLVRPGEQGQRDIVRAVEAIANDPPEAIAGRTVAGMVDYRIGAEHRPPWLGAQPLVQLDLDGGRILARPSGTEPKLKIYVDIREDVIAATTREELQIQRESCLSMAEQTAREFASMLEGRIQAD